MFIPVDVAELELAGTLPDSLFYRPVVGPVVMMRGCFIIACVRFVNIGVGFEGCRVVFTICVFVLAKIVVQYEILDALLFLFLSLLLVLHSNRKVRVGRQCNCTSLQWVSKYSSKH